MEKDFWGKKISFLYSPKQASLAQRQIFGHSYTKANCPRFWQENGDRDNVGIVPLADREASKKAKSVLLSNLGPADAFW